MSNPFQRASKAKAKLRLAVIGPSGSGKTWTSLAIATRLAELSSGRVAVIDTERGSASLYSDLFEFDVLELSTFSPQQYMDAIHAADEAGYAVVLIDSLSHAWAGPGGVLEFVDNTARRQQTGNSFAAWRDGTKLQNAMVDAMLGAKAHLIVTMRSKQEYVQEKDDRGRTIIRKVGMQPVQRDGLDYEFTITADMDTDHNFMVSKTRIPSLADRVITKPSGALADELHRWLESGAEPAPQSPAAALGLNGHTNGAAPAMTQHEALSAMNARPSKSEQVARFGAVLKRLGFDSAQACEVLNIEPNGNARAALQRTADGMGAEGWGALAERLEATEPQPPNAPDGDDADRSDDPLEDQYALNATDVSAQPELLHTRPSGDVVDRRGKVGR